MALKFPADWKFEGIGFEIPRKAINAFYNLLLEIAEGSQTVVEKFKAAFGGVGTSSSYDWATTDLDRQMTSRAENAALFVDNLWSCLEFARKRELVVPSEKFVNKILAEHGVPLRIDPPNLSLVNDATIVADSTEVSEESFPKESVSFSRLVLKEEIGKGGYGIVHRATRTTTVDEFEYAVKILDPTPFVKNRDKALERFRREVKALHKLQHRAIVNYIEAGVTADGKPYVVMPLIAGKDLRRFAKSLPQKDCLSIFVEILLALDYAHQQDVIHRDLKPSNIIVRGSDRQPVILDFGSAYILDQLDSNTLTTQAVGTIGYIPSEVLADPKIRSPLHDIYACGVMLYEVFAGRRPDPANYMSLGGVRNDLSRLDPIVIGAIAGASKRTKTAKAFADQLASLGLGKP